MNTLPTRFDQRHPVAAFVLLYLGMLAVYIIGGTIAAVGKLDPIFQGLLSNAALMVVSLLLVARLSWWKEVGLGLPPCARPWLLAWLPFLAALTPLLDGIRLTDPAQIALILTLAIMVGFVEEVFFRGLFMRLMRPFGTAAMLLWPTLLFSLSHVMNVLAGQSWLVTLIQIANAAAAGFLLAVLRLRGGTIWPLITLHALMDFLSWLSLGGLGVEPERITNQMMILPAVFAVAFLVNGVWLLRAPHQRAQGDRAA